MQYAVIITRTTGKNIEEKVFDTLAQAHAYYQHVVKTTPYKRVLIILSEKRETSTEDIIDVHFIDGVNYNMPKTYGASAPGNSIISPPHLDSSLDAQTA